jgi:hypothetical protein
MSPFEQAEQIVAQATYSPLDVTREPWKRINPKFSMIARTFISWLRNETVLSRLEHAQTIDDLKALLVVDEYLARVRQLEHRRQIQELVANTQVPLDLIEVYAALTYLQEALLVANEIPVAERVEHELDRVVYTAEAAARQLGWNTEELYEAIARDDVRAELCIRLGELLRVRRQADAIRYPSGSPAPSDDPSAEPTP